MHQGLLPLEFSRQTGLPVLNRQASVLTVGAMADSYYEYLLKMWLLGNKTVRSALLLLGSLSEALLLAASSPDASRILLQAFKVC